MNNGNHVWGQPNLNYRLPVDEVHVWRARVSSSAAAINVLGRLLSPEERRRADRFRSEHDRARFILGRIVARSVLGHCLQQPATEIQLAPDHFGKPVVASATPLHFNISHSGDQVLMATARDRRVGIDVEEVREIADMNEIAARYFSKAEYSRLQTVPERMRAESFYRCWTLKEAYLKARGEGFKLPLDSFDVAFLAGEAPQLVETRFDPADATRWCFRGLDLGSAYLAALATEVGAQLELKLWEWNGWKGSGWQGAELVR